MTPKFVELHRFETGKLIDEYKVIYVNPRRVDYFEPVPPPSAQPILYCGTKVALGSKQSVIVHETVTEIVRLLKK